jgi:hypothetical protein
MFECIGSSSSSSQVPIPAEVPFIASAPEVPCTPPRTDPLVSGETIDVIAIGTELVEESKDDNEDVAFGAQMAAVIPSPIKITKADNPLVCALKFFVLASTPRIAIAMSIQNLPSAETQQGMQGFVVYNSFELNICYHQYSNVQVNSMLGLWNNCANDLRKQKTFMKLFVSFQRLFINQKI